MDNLGKPCSGQAVLRTDLDQEWKSHLRSAIHPAIFALCYRAADKLCSALSLTGSIRAEILLATPKTIQALVAAAGDYYTWKLAESTYGSTSLATAAALVLTVASPWQWFCSTRTFSNCLETTLTVVALYNWPWHWSVPANGNGKFQVDTRGLRLRDADGPSKGGVDETTRLRRALLFVAVATVLRPTNVLIWFALLILTFFRSAKRQWLIKVPGTEQSALLEASAWSLVPNKNECLTFAREILLCGTAVLGLSAIVDHIYYNAWTFPPLNFLYINIVQSLAIFYGNNDWHYYLTQGYPLLLTTALPFALIGIYNVLRKPASNSKLSSTSQTILADLAIVSMFVPACLSLISHKEVRFIYPLLPGLHVLAAQPIYRFFAPVFQQAVLTSTRRVKYFKAMLLFGLLSLNLGVAIYTSQIHNSGIINVMHYLRHEFESQYVTGVNNGHLKSSNMTVGFLMPCHSTPWRSHLQYAPSETLPGIDGWALTCEPPLNMDVTEKAAYVDEADQFYLDPNAWLKRRMSRNPPTINGRQLPHHEPGVFAPKPRRMFEVENKEEEHLWRERGGRRPWPEYLIFFQQIEPELTRSLRGSGYLECWRGFNSHWHDDWRRQGDIVVWCLWPERSQTLIKAKAAQAQLDAETETAKQKIKRLPDRVVEKPFWKQRPLLDEPEPKWWERILGLRKTKVKSWMNGGRWR